jgi:nitroreductase
MTLKASELNEKKKAPDVSGVLPLFHERWSPRSFSDREVSRETLAKVFEAARWAASSSNEQPWKYIVGLRGTETHKRIFESLAAGNQKWAAKVPVLVISTAHKAFAKNDAPNRFALHDLGAANAQLVLEAHALGLAAHQMGGYDEAKARQLLGIPDDYLTGSAIALGYQDDPEQLGDAGLIEREVAPRTRKPLSETVLGAWGEPLGL